MTVKIDLFTPNRSLYSVLQHFTAQFHKALSRQGIQCREVTLSNPNTFIHDILENAPDYTASFNEVQPDHNGRYLCDLLQIPHVNIIVDRPDHYFISVRGSYDLLMSSPRSILTFPDRKACQLFEDIDYPSVFFLPHAVEQELSISPESPRRYGAVMMCSLIDYIPLSLTWKNKYPHEIVTAMEETLHTCLQDPAIPYYRAFARSLGLLHNDRFTPEIVKFGPPLNDIEAYLRGADRIALLKSFRELPIDLFGYAAPGTDWNNYLFSQKNITIHDPVNYKEALQIMGQSKIVLNSSPTIYDGAHERIFTAMACGAAVLTGSTPFLLEDYIHGQSILYRNSDQESLVTGLLKDETRRQTLAVNAQKITAEKNTWDQRAASLISYLFD